VQVPFSLAGWLQIQPNQFPTDFSYSRFICWSSLLSNMCKMTSHTIWIAQSLICLQMSMSWWASTKILQEHQLNSTIFPGGSSNSRRSTVLPAVVDTPFSDLHVGPVKTELSVSRPLQNHQLIVSKPGNTIKTVVCCFCTHQGCIGMDTHEEMLPPSFLCSTHIVKTAYLMNIV